MGEIWEDRIPCTFKKDVFISSILFESLLLSYTQHIKYTIYVLHLESCKHRLLKVNQNVLSLT